MADRACICLLCRKITFAVLEKDEVNRDYESWAYMRCQSCKTQWHVCSQHMKRWAWEDSIVALRHFQKTKHKEIVTHTPIEMPIDTIVVNNMNNTRDLIQDNMSSTFIPNIPNDTMISITHTNQSYSNTTQSTRQDLATHDLQTDISSYMTQKRLPDSTSLLQASNSPL